MSLLKEQLSQIDRQKSIQRKNRGRLIRVALVGYTNVGKSSLLQALSGSDIFVKDQLFATLDPTARKVQLGSGLEMVLTDTVIETLSIIAYKRSKVRQVILGNTCKELGVDKAPKLR